MKETVLCAGCTSLLQLLVITRIMCKSFAKIITSLQTVNVSDKTVQLADQSLYLMIYITEKFVT